jgi:hypothetical protein
MVQEAHGAQVLLDPDYRPKNVFCSNKNTGVCYMLSFIMFSPKHTVEAAEPPQSYFGPHYSWFCVRARSRKSRHDQVDFWEGTLQLNYNKLSLTMIDHGSRRTWGPGPSRSRLQTQKHDLPTLKQTFPTTFVL